MQPANCDNPVRRLHVALLTLVIAASFTPAVLLAQATEGAIKARIESARPVLRAWAIARTHNDEGVYHHLHEAQLNNGQLQIANLPVPGVYDLKFETESGTLEGWNAAVPASDYVEEHPLAPESRQTILAKMSAPNVTAYDDQVLVLDLQGNIQNAVVLTTHLRTTPFVGGGYKPGEWTWRVRRSQWENPDEHTWVPLQERPYYSLVRSRLAQADYSSIRILYCRHLGGIRLEAENPQIDLGTLTLPAVPPGIAAANPDGSLIAPIQLKPSASGASGRQQTGVSIDHGDTP